MAAPTDRKFAISLDQEDPLKFTRDEFVIPTISQITSNRLHNAALTNGMAGLKISRSASDDKDATKPCTYLCGNSLGLQPRRTATRIKQYLDTWGAQGVQGHFKPLEDSPLPIWLDADARAAKMMAPLVGARESEVAIMQTLTVNLHMLMSAFYKPNANGRHKIILESKAFPSDHVSLLAQCSVSS